MTAKWASRGTMEIADCVVRATSAYLMVDPRDWRRVPAPRNAPFVRARHLSAKLLREEGFSLPMIGHLLGGLDHSSVKYALRIVASDPMLARDAEILRRKVGRSAARRDVIEQRAQALRGHP